MQREYTNVWYRVAKSGTGYWKALFDAICVEFFVFLGVHELLLFFLSVSMFE
jgi:hypothetical protein